MVVYSCLNHKLSRYYGYKELRMLVHRRIHIVLEQVIDLLSCSITLCLVKILRSKRAQKRCSVSLVSFKVLLEIFEHPQTQLL